MNFGTFLWYLLPLSGSCSGNLEGEGLAGRQARVCLGKLHLKHHLTHSTLGFAFILGHRQGAQCADPCSDSLVPLVPIFQHAHKNKVEKKWWHMDLFKRKEKSREAMLSTGQDSFSSMPWVGGVPHGQGRGSLASSSPPVKARWELLIYPAQSNTARAGAAGHTSCQTSSPEGLQSWTWSTNTPAVSLGALGVSRACQSSLNPFAGVCKSNHT